MTQILAVANQKGGVGKTTTAVNLAAGMARLGRSVLLVDLDPQGNASTHLGIAANRRRPGSYAMLTDGWSPVRPLATAVENLTVIPADMDLAGAEIELVDRPDRAHLLRHALAAAESRADIIVIDCPPSLGLLTLNALTAAQRVLIPMQCEFLALEGLAHLTRTVETIRKSLNPGLLLAGIVLTMFDRRNNLSELVAADVRGFFGDAVLQTAIPRNVKLSEAPSHGMPIALYDPRSPGAAAYERLAVELLDRLARVTA